MQVIWSEHSRKVHDYTGHRTDERCNVDEIHPEDRRVQEAVDPTDFARTSKLKLCKRCMKEWLTPPDTSPNP